MVGNNYRIKLHSGIFKFTRHLGNPKPITLIIKNLNTVFAGIFSSSANKL